jgi:hypothetical protein
MACDKKIEWKPIMLEAAFVVLGVVLALTANGIREAYNNQRRAETALVSILDELASNQEAVAAAIDYHGALIDTLSKFTSAYGNDPSRYPSGAVFSRGFVSPGQTVSRAWEAAATTGVIEYMPYDEVLLLSQLYEDQRLYQVQGMAVSEQIYGRIFDQGVQGVIRNYRNLQTVIGTLARAYAGILPRFPVDSSVGNVHESCQYMPTR